MNEGDPLIEGFLWCTLHIYSVILGANRDPCVPELNQRRRQLENGGITTPMQFELRSASVVALVAAGCIETMSGNYEESHAIQRELDSRGVSFASEIKKCALSDPDAPSDLLERLEKCGLKPSTEECDQSFVELRLKKAVRSLVSQLKHMFLHGPSPSERSFMQGILAAIEDGNLRLVCWVVENAVQRSMLTLEMMRPAFKHCEDDSTWRYWLFKYGGANMERLFRVWEVDPLRISL